TFFALPCLSRGEPAGPVPGSKNMRAYYPDLKRTVRDVEEAFEGQIRTQLSNFTIPASGTAARSNLESLLSVSFSTDPPPYSDTKILELLLRLWMRAVHQYLGKNIVNRLRSYRYYLRNFYHWFVCDFLKLVADPLEGIPG